MGFLDKAKKLAEQAQTKLDEVQGQFNQEQSAPSGPITEYDKHGRPVPPAESATPPQGDPLAAPAGEAATSAPPPPPASPAPPPASPAPPAASVPPPAPPAPGLPPTASEAVTSAQPEAAPAAPASEAPPAAPPAPPAPGLPPTEDDRNHPSYAPPTLTSGDPLAG
jgi:formin 2/WAS/WASL-interacting protein